MKYFTYSAEQHDHKSISNKTKAAEQALAVSDGFQHLLHVLVTFAIQNIVAL